MQRYDFHGDPIRGSVFTAKCYECGMATLNATEFHPYEACETFKRTHDSDEVWKVLMPLMRERLGSAPSAAK